MLEELRYRRAVASKGLWRGDSPQLPIIPAKIGFRETILGSLFLGLMATLVVLLIEWMFNIGGRSPGTIAQGVGFWVMWMFILLPFVRIFWNALRHWQRPDFTQLRRFSFAQRTIANAAIAFYLTLILESLYPWWLNTWHNTLAPTLIHAFPTFKQWLTTAPTHHLVRHEYHHTAHALKASFHWQMHTFFTLWICLIVVLGIFTHWLSHRPTTPKPRQRYRKGKALKQADKLPFGLWIGEATGQLAELAHQASIAAKQQVALFHDDLAQNILILGAIGSGKTTRAVHPFLIQLLDQQCGGLIFDIKGDFHQAVNRFAEITKRNYSVLGPTQTPFNLLAGLPPEIAASFLKSAFLLSGNRFDSFWMDTATELCRNALGVLSFLPEHYSLHGLHCYLFDNAWRDERAHELTILIPTLEDNQKRLLSGYQHYENAIFNSFDDKVKAGVKATIAQILAPFNHPELIDAFCTAHPNSARLEDVLDGEVYLINLPLARWGLGGKVAYTLIKLRFFNIMQSRATQSSWNQERYVFFLCDEYQEIVSANKDGLSDLNFWDKSRSSKTIGIISAQSVSSFYAALGDRDLSDALIQNFMQKICFRTQDQNTINMLNRLLGTVEVTRVTQGESAGDTSGWQHSSSHSGTSTSYTTHDKPLLDGQFFRTLSGDYALAILSFNGMNFDDVLKMQPYFV